MMTSLEPYVALRGAAVEPRTLETVG
jgi:hypothetical protein